jgi:hypothetical protein
VPQSDPTVLHGYGVQLIYADSYFRVSWECGSEVTIRRADHEVRARIGRARSPSVDAIVLELSARMAVPKPGLGSMTVELSFSRTLTPDVERLAARINGGLVTAEGLDTDPMLPDWVSSGRQGAGRPHGEGPVAADVEAEAPDAGGPDAERAGDEPMGAAEPDPVRHEPSAQEAPPLAAGPGPAEPAGAPPGPAERRGQSRLRHQQPAGPHPATQPAAAHAGPLPIVSFRADLSAWVDDPEWIGLYPTQETIRLVEFPPSGPAREHSFPPSA